MGVPGQKDLGGPDGGRIVGAIPMAMGQKDGQALPGNGGGTGVHGKHRPQGARTAVTVSLYPQNLPGQGAEQLDDLVGVVFILGSIGPGIDQVPQQDKLLGAFLLIAFQQLPAEPGGTMEIGRDESLHGESPRSLVYRICRQRASRGKRPEIQGFPVTRKYIFNLAV